MNEHEVRHIHLEWVAWVTEPNLRNTCKCKPEGLMSEEEKKSFLATAGDQQNTQNLGLPGIFALLEKSPLSPNVGATNY